MSTLQLDPHRALPFPAEQRSIAWESYSETKDLPLICVHGHVEPEVFADDIPFADPAQLLIVPDHYVFRMLSSQGVEPLSSGCRGSMGARSRRTLGRFGVRSARTGSSSVARPRATGWNTSSSKFSGLILSRAPRRLTPFMTRSPLAWRTLSSVSGRCWTASTSRSSLQRTRLRRTCATTPSLPPTVWASAFFRPSGPTP